MKAKEHDPYVVSKDTCGGCKFYKSLGGCQCDATMFCSYTIDTGKFKPMDMPCAECTYKDTGRKRRTPTKGWK